MVKPDFDLWTGTDPIFRVVNGSVFYVRSVLGSGRVGFFLLLTPSFVKISLIFFSSLLVCYEIVQNKTTL
ncbi:hypothetical protein Hanom_Chr07g00627181 [Helianthus anomalus]